MTDWRPIPGSVEPDGRPSPPARAAYWWALEIAKTWPMEAPEFWRALTWFLLAQRVREFGCREFTPSRVLALAVERVGIRWGWHRWGDRKESFPFPYFTWTTLRDDGRVVIVSGTGEAAIWEVP